MISGTERVVEEGKIQSVARWCHGVVGVYGNETAIFFNSGFEDEVAVVGDRIVFEHGVFKKE